jgi:ELWxxDGT repeat protein
MIFKYFFKTALNVVLVEDINPGPADAVDIPEGVAPQNQYAHGFAGALYFQANDGQSGAELWRTTGLGAELVADIVPGPEGSAPHAFAVYQNALYFAATTPETGEELFRYDGTSVSLAADIDPGPNRATIGGRTVYNGALYFTRQVSTQPPKTKVWRFDGTSASPVAAINQTVDQIQGFTSFDGYVRTFTVFNGRLFYILITPEPYRYQLWAFDGANVQKIANLTPENDWVALGFDLGVFNGALYFGVIAQVEQPVPPNYLDRQDELWSYDGQSSPKKIGELEINELLGPEHDYLHPKYFQVFKNCLYFCRGINLYRYDGVSLQQVQASIPRAPSNLSLYTTNSVDLLYLTRDPSSYPGYNLPGPFFFDGLQTYWIYDFLDPDSQLKLGQSTFAVQVGDRLYFYTTNIGQGRELWSVQGMSILKLIVVLAPIWEDKRNWPVREDVHELVLATYLVVEGQKPRLLARTNIDPPSESERLQLTILEIDRSRDELPDAFGLLSIVFDRRTGQKLDTGFEVFGFPTDRARAEMMRTAAAYGEEVGFPRLMSARVQRLDQAQRLKE